MCVWTSSGTHLAASHSIAIRVLTRKGLVLTQQLIKNYHGPPINQASTDPRIVRDPVTSCVCARMRVRGSAVGPEREVPARDATDNVPRYTRFLSPTNGTGPSRESRRAEGGPAKRVITYRGVIGIVPPLSSVHVRIWRHESCGRCRRIVMSDSRTHERSSGERTCTRYC